MALSMIRRDRLRIDLLAGFPIGVLRDSGGQADEFQHDPEGFGTWAGEKQL